VKDRRGLENNDGEESPQRIRPVLVQKPQQGAKDLKDGQGREQLGLEQFNEAGDVYCKVVLAPSLDELFNVGGLDEAGVREVLLQGKIDRARCQGKDAARKALAVFGLPKFLRRRVQIRLTLKLDLEQRPNSTHTLHLHNVGLSSIIRWLDE
jgi:hypothetical protein